MKKVLLSAFDCHPHAGSEAGNGWNWTIGLASNGYEVHCLTWGVNRLGIEQAEKPDHIHFHYISLPYGLDFLFAYSQATMYLHYMLWQYKAYLKAKSLHRNLTFDIVHHVTWGSLQMGSFLYKLKIPIIFGPAGGGQKAPEAFKAYFLSHWSAEQKREKVSDLMVKFNPAFTQMIKKAAVVLTSNTDTLEMAQRFGAKNVFLTLDAALPDGFFPAEFFPKHPKNGALKLLWVGRFMPRKGLLLSLDVMNKLKDYSGITLTIVGDGEMKDDVVGKIKLYGLENTVTLTGRVPYEQVREFYASHDVFFFTSLRDSCPAQLIEAGAFGLPVVTINLHGQAIIVNENTGVICDCATPELAIDNLRDAIIDLYNNHGKVTVMSNAAFEFAKKQTWEIKIKNVIKQFYPV